MIVKHGLAAAIGWLDGLGAYASYILELVLVVFAHSTVAILIHFYFNLGFYL